MNSFHLAAGFTLALALTHLGCRSAQKADAPSHRARVGYVLHVLNDFTESIRRGAEDAASAANIDIDVQGPAGSSAQDAIGIFEGMVQRHVDGLVVVPAPGDVWVNPIRRAISGGVPVVTANITSPQSTAPAWFGQDERKSGVILAEVLKKSLAEHQRDSGTIVVGICAPGVEVLVDRFEGLREGLKGTKFVTTEPRDVTVPNTTNYATWESLAGANPDAAALVGLCSMDVPNLAKIKTRTSAKWLVLGYDLNRESLDALKGGSAEALIGQHPYLQGYLPVRALAEHLRDKAALPKGWVDVGTEVITRANVAEVYTRETDREAGRSWYAKHMQSRFVQLASLVRPLPGAR